MSSCLHHLAHRFCNPTLMNALWQVWAMSKLTYQPPLKSREAEETSSFTLSSDIQSSGFLDHTCPLSHQQTPHHKQSSCQVSYQQQKLTVNIQKIAVCSNLVVINLFALQPSLQSSLRTPKAILKVKGEKMSKQLLIYLKVMTQIKLLYTC